MFANLKKRLSKNWSMTVIAYKVYGKSSCNFLFYFVYFFFKFVIITIFIKLLCFSRIVFLYILYLNDIICIIHLIKVKDWKNSFDKRILTSLSNLALTVGVVIPVSLDICLKDFLPSFE